MKRWRISERSDRWVVHRDNVLQHGGDAESAWSYVAARVESAELVTVRYHTGREGLSLTGRLLRALLGGKRSAD